MTEQEENLYFPFASQEEWQFASWLLRSCLSMSAIDSLLSLDIVRQISPYCFKQGFDCSFPDEVHTSLLSECEAATGPCRNIAIGSDLVL